MAFFEARKQQLNGVTGALFAERRDSDAQEDIRDDAAGPRGAGHPAGDGPGDERALRTAVRPGTAGPPSEAGLPVTGEGQGALQQQRPGLLRAGGQRLVGTAV